MSGKLYGVGVGPGDPKLMTYLAVETIQNCPVIAVPADGKEHAISYKIASGIVKNMESERMSGTVFTDDEKTGKNFLEKGNLSKKYQKKFIKKLDEGKMWHT